MLPLRVGKSSVYLSIYIDFKNVGQELEFDLFKYISNKRMRSPTSLFPENLLSINRHVTSKTMYIYKCPEGWYFSGFSLFLQFRITNVRKMYMHFRAIRIQ